MGGSALRDRPVLPDFVDEFGPQIEAFSQAIRGGPIPPSCGRDGYVDMRSLKLSTAQPKPVFLRQSNSTATWKRRAGLIPWFSASGRCYAGRLRFHPSCPGFLSTVLCRGSRGTGQRRKAILLPFHSLSNSVHGHPSF